MSPLCRALACTVVLAAALFGCSRPGPPVVAPPEPAPPGSFEDVTAGSGLHFTYRNGQEAGHYSILESLGGGVALIDYDRDGLLDIFVTGGGDFDGPDKKTIRGHPNRLYRNEGNWHFRDVTAEVGLPAGEGPFYSHGAAVGDYDGDGWPDLLVTGYGRLALYRNDRGRFVDVTERAGLLDKRPVHWSTSAAWADFDGDGRPDLFVCHYVNWSFANHPRCPGYRPDVTVDVCPPKQFDGLVGALYLNRGDGTFVDVTREAGLKAGKGLGVVVADLDDDGRPDIYVANDTTENFLYLNRIRKTEDRGQRTEDRGQRSAGAPATAIIGRSVLGFSSACPLSSVLCPLLPMSSALFEEAGVSRGVAYDDAGVPNGSMGVDAADYNGTGRLSLFVTNYQNEAHALYRNVGRGQFQYASQAAGVAAIGLTYVGFGTGFIDFDRDGAEDLFISNGHVVRYPQDLSTLTQRPVLLRNQFRPGDRPSAVTFRNVTDRGGPYFLQKHMGRGVALGDLDNDGRTDLVVSHTNEPVALLRNVVDNGHHWLGVALTGRGNRDIVGARLTLEVDGRQLVRVIKGGGSYLSSGDPRVIFGLGGTKRTGRLTVRWPSGTTDAWENLPIDQYSHLAEGDPTPRPARRSGDGASP